MLDQQNTNNSSHLGWIKLQNRYYKIFYFFAAYERAELECKKYDQQSSLAVIVSYNDAQALGRYMLIGRPSMENAWIGGKWKNGSYVFDQEDLVLDNTPNENKYPPWREYIQRKKEGCLLLDRHLDNVLASKVYK